MRSVEMRSPTPRSAAAMPPIKSSSISFGTTDATMNPSELTTAAPMTSGMLARIARRRSLILSLLVLIAGLLFVDQFLELLQVRAVDPVLGLELQGALPLGERAANVLAAQKLEATVEAGAGALGRRAPPRRSRGLDAIDDDPRAARKRIGGAVAVRARREQVGDRDRNRRA